MTKAELMAQLDELGVAYDPSSTKAVLESMLAHPSTDAPAPAPAAGRPPVWEAGESRSEYHAKVHAWKLGQAR